ncbi:hypothetical protein [Geodermatophilus sp. CPCC 206100]
MSWWVWPLLAWIPMTVVIAAYWWTPRWTAVKRQLTRPGHAARVPVRLR